MSLGVEISIFLLIVAAAGLMDLPVLSPIESILPAINHGLKWLFRLKLSLTARLEEAAMVEILWVFTLLPRVMVYLKRHVKHIWLKILPNLVALISKNVKTVSLLKLLSLEMPDTAGLNPNIQFGKWPNTVQLQEQTKWKQSCLHEDLFHAELKLPSN